MVSIRQPHASASATRLGRSARWQLYGLIPLAIGAILSLTVFESTFSRVLCLAFGAYFGLLTAIVVRVRVVIDGDHLLMRNSLWWKTIALDRLTEVKAHDGGRGGPGIRLEDQEHHHCWIRVEPLRPHERKVLHAELERRLAVGSVRLTGDLERTLLSK